MVGRNKELSQDSVFALEVNQPASPTDYVLMVIDNLDGVPMDELEITEAKLFINKLFIKGDYRYYADKLKIKRNDFKRILYEASTFLCNKNISCTIALVLKSVKESRDVFVSHTGTGASFIINSKSVSILNEKDSPGNEKTLSVRPGLLEKPKLFNVKLKKEDTLLLCSQSLSVVLDINSLQQIVFSSKGPEEICKKILHSVSGVGRKDNISIAAFNYSGTRKNPDKKRIPNKTLLLIIIPLLLILIGFLIYFLSSGTKEKPVETSPIGAFESSKLPPETNKDNINQQSMVNTPVSEDKNIITKNENNVKTPENIVKKFKNVNFIVNGSVVIISNWESVKQEILYINWDNGITDKKRIHKYPDYTRIPFSVKVTYKDNSTVSYRTK